MSIIEANPAPVKSTTTTLTIKGIAYDVQPIDAGECGTQAVRLCKHHRDAACYDVIRTHNGLVECDCPDYECRHRGTSSLCKHGRAVVDAGLIDAPKVIITPAHVAAFGVRLPASTGRPGIDRVRDEFDEPATVEPTTAPVETVEIEGKPHAVRTITGRDGGTFWRLVPLTDPTARDAEVYAADGHLRCDCGENHTGEPCRHVAALIDLGTIEAPATIWPAWTDSVRFGIDPAAWEGEGHGEHGEDLGPADPEDAWDDWTDADDFRVAIHGPDADEAATDPTDDEGERLTLLGFLEAQLAHFRAIGSDAADLIAEAVGDLVAECRILGCPTDAATFHARRDALLRN